MITLANKEKKTEQQLSILVLQTRAYTFLATVYPGTKKFL